MFASAAALLRYRKLIGFGLIALAFVAFGVTLHLTRADLKAARAERDLAIEQRNHWIAESDRRKATGKRTLEADKPKSEQRTKARDAVQLRDGECETDPEIIAAVEKGWVR